MLPPLPKAGSQSIDTDENGLKASKRQRADNVSLHHERGPTTTLEMEQFQRVSRAKMPRCKGVKKYCEMRMGFSFPHRILNIACNTLLFSFFAP